MHMCRAGGAYCILRRTQSNRCAACAMLETAAKAMEEKKNGEDTKGPKNDTKTPSAKAKLHSLSSKDAQGL